MAAKNSLSMLSITGFLCAAFALSACSAEDGPALPARGTPEAKALYEQCLKTLPAGQAAQLKQLQEAEYFSEIIERDDLLRSCNNMQNAPAP